MRANRFVVAIVGAALAVSFALPGIASAQEEKWQTAFKVYQAGDFAQAETLFREVCTEYEDAGVPWGWCHLMLGTTLAQRGASKRWPMHEMHSARARSLNPRSVFGVLK